MHAKNSIIKTRTVTKFDISNATRIRACYLAAASRPHRLRQKSLQRARNHVRVYLRRATRFGHLPDTLNIASFQTNLQVVSQTEFLFSLPSAQAVNHIVVFLLPTTQLPPDYAATVYFQWPGRPFQLLGGLSMEKQSAIFRLKGNTPGVPGSVPAGTSASDSMVDEPSLYPTGEGVTVQLGISIEPIGQVQQKLMTLPAHLSSLSAAPNPQQAEGSLVLRDSMSAPQPLAHRDSAATLTLARRIIKNAFNYLGSFSSGPPGSETIPMREFQSWWNKFERRLAIDSTFLEREEDT